MTIENLLEGIEPKIPWENRAVSTVTRDSRQVGVDSLFFCIKGVMIDGHDYARQALDQGASGIVVERDLGLPRQILVEDTSYAYGIAAGNYFGNPSRQLKLLGITGTNGKTTTAYIIQGVLEHAGRKTGLIGTVENRIGTISLQAHHTTPDPLELHRLFHRMVEAGCEYVVMEVSSHGLDQHRLAGCNFQAVGFTNLTQDHLDYHGTMENYFQAKAALFSMTSYGIVNKEDCYGQRLLHESSLPLATFSSQGEEATFFPRKVRFSERGSQFDLVSGEESYPVAFVQPGIFSIENVLCATGICVGAGLTLKEVAEGLSQISNIPGRFEQIPTDTEFTVIRDFAHSADGLDKLLSTVKEFVKGRIVVVFGCAGERDRTKRKEMSAAVARYADVAILTADNPRHEPIGQIIQDALPGFQGTEIPYHIFEDRFDAMVWALYHSQPGDFLIFAGKGHEDYQVLPFGSVNFNEKEMVPELLHRMAQGERWSVIE